MIYTVEVQDISDAWIRDLCAFVDVERRDKVQRFRNKKDRIRALIADILIRYLIHEKLNLKNTEIVFSKNEYGKPYLLGIEDFHFNLSHSGDFVVCAIDHQPVGVDIEQVSPIEYESLAHRFFTEDEFHSIMQEKVENQLNRFYEVWTLKESYIKAEGVGLSIPLKSFSVNSLQQNAYSLRTIAFDENYKMAVCRLRESIVEPIVRIDQIKLISYFFSIA